MNFFNNYNLSIFQNLKKVNEVDLIKISNIILKAKKSDNKLIIVGNGGSAAMASHVSVDFTKICKIRAVNFNEANLLTCYANDYGYENWVSECLESYAKKKDVVILISSSGKSKNIINGAKKANKMGLKTITLTGFEKNNPVKKLGLINLWADSKKYNIVEMVHHIWLLSICDFIAQNKSRIK
jgi:D-sedoheptulose 7-phosphate isomerase